MKITSYKQVDALYQHGFNLCKGCECEHAASCHEGRFPQCTAQYDKIRTAQTDKILQDCR